MSILKGLFKAFIIIFVSSVFLVIFAILQELYSNIFLEIIYIFLSGYIGIFIIKKLFDKLK